MSCMHSKMVKSHPGGQQAGHLAVSLRQSQGLRAPGAHTWAHEGGDSDREQGFTKGQSCLTHLTASCNTIVGTRGGHLPLL